MVCVIPTQYPKNIDVFLQQFHHARYLEDFLRNYRYHKTDNTTQWWVVAVSLIFFIKICLGYFGWVKKNIPLFPEYMSVDIMCVFKFFLNYNFYFYLHLLFLDFYINSIYGVVYCWMRWFMLRLLTKFISLLFVMWLLRGNVSRSLKFKILLI